MNIGKKLGALALAPLLGYMLVVGGEAQAADGNSTQSGGKAMELEQQWDKTFQKSDKVDHSKVTFKNRYGITLVADVYVPQNAQGKMPAIAVTGPFGAVKEQAAGLYAQTMAERGFLTLAFDP